MKSSLLALQTHFSNTVKLVCIYGVCTDGKAPISTIFAILHCCVEAYGSTEYVRLWLMAQQNKPTFFAKFLVQAYLVL